MLARFKGSLIFITILAIFCGFSQNLMAQEIKVQAVPPIEVESAVLPPLEPTGLVVAELFSSQACLFCPKADEYLNELSEKKNVIALACHVDYYDVPEGSLAQPFCTQRQNQYSKTLRSGPKFTPQMVLNGSVFAIGHKREKVSRALNRVASKEISEIPIKLLDNGKYRLDMPGVETGQYALWVALVEAPLTRKIAQGKNRGQEVEYKNIVSSLKSPSNWSGQEGPLDLSVELSDTQIRLAVFAQDQVSGHIVAAGQYRK